MQKGIYAAIWIDFVPLSLILPTPEEAIAKALELRQRGKGIIADVRAVFLADGSDELVDLIEREEEIAA